jgi:hypothetical protein
MARCEVCGNEYDKSFQVIIGDKTHVFDCFECAIQALAPTCAHCGCRVIGHGLESDGKVYCCANCATLAGVHGLHDRVTRHPQRPERPQQEAEHDPVFDEEWI